MSEQAPDSVHHEVEFGRLAPSGVVRWRRFNSAVGYFNAWTLWHRFSRMGLSLILLDCSKYIELHEAKNDVFLQGPDSWMPPERERCGFCFGWKEPWKLPGGDMRHEGREGNADA